MRQTRGMEKRRKRRQYLEKALTDAVPVSKLCDVLSVTPQTLYRDWKTIEDGWIEDGILYERFSPHRVYMLALAQKIDLLTRLRIDQWTIGNLLSVSQGHVSKMKRWAETNGLYSDTAIRILCFNGVRTVDESTVVPPGEYEMRDANEYNVFLTNEQSTYIVKCDDLVDRHELISPYLRNWDTGDVPITL